MIKSLHMEHIAVVKCLDVDFERGLTVLSGETGAGKSIMIDGLNLLLGGRADRDLIRSGENGYLVPPDDPEAIVETVTACLQQPEKMHAVAQAGRAAALQLTWERNAQAYCNLMERMV